MSRGHELLFVGIGSSAVAIDAETGAIFWSRNLDTRSFVSVLWDGEALFAANQGEVWRLDPGTGETMWHNPLKGYGIGLVSLASSRAPSPTAEAAIAAEDARRRAARNAAM